MAVDPNGTNPNSVYDANMGSNDRGGIRNTGTTNGSRYAVKPNMGDKPVNYVSWFDAARVANWLHHGAQTYAITDASANAPQNTGAYTLGTLTSGTAPARNAGALFSIPTENEWYKAAYYNPTLNGGAGGYHVYGNGFDTQPTAVTASATGVGSAGGTGNFVNYDSRASWNGQNGNVTTVGTNGGASFYGAFDMSGNVWEWNDLTGAAGSSRGRRGGSWSGSAFSLSSSGGNTPGPSGEGGTVGFRLASPFAPLSFITSSLFPSPSAVTAVVAGTTATLRWQPPQAAAAPHISGYVVQSSTDGGATWTTRSDTVAASATDHAITGLAPGGGVSFRIAARNSNGTGGFSEPTPPVMPGTATPASSVTIDEGMSVTYTTSLEGIAPEGIALPPPPTGLFAEPTAGGLAVSWTASLDPVEAAVRDYILEWSSDGGATWNTVSDGTSRTPSAAITGLDVGVPHLVRVSATNQFGISEPTVLATAVAPMPNVPAAPAGIVATAGDGTATLTWTPPLSDGGSPITGYAIRTSVDRGVTWTEPTNVPADHTSLLVNGLVNGVAVVFDIATVNETGPSITAQSGLALPAAPAVLREPELFAVQALQDGSYGLSWRIGGDTGIAPAGYWLLSKYRAPGSNWLPREPLPIPRSAVSLAEGSDGLHASTTITGLPSSASVPLELELKLVSTLGTLSSESDWVSASSSYVSLPGQPRALRAHRTSDSEYELDWEPAPSQGPIFGYEVEYSANWADEAGGTWHILASTTDQSTHVSVAMPETELGYAFRVRARAASGVGMPSLATRGEEQVPGTPAVEAVDATSVDLTWSAGTEAGPLTTRDYLVEYKQADASDDAWVVSPGPRSRLSARVEGLAPGESYAFRVRALNEIGLGYVSGSSEMVTLAAAPPPAPTIERVTAAPGIAHLTWAIGDDIGVTITGFAIEQSTDAGASWQAGATVEPLTAASRSATMSGLTNGQSYVFRVSAVGETGTSAPSQASGQVTPVPNLRVNLDPRGDGSGSLLPDSAAFTATAHMFAPRLLDGGEPAAVPAGVIADGDRSWTYLSTARLADDPALSTAAVRVRFVAPWFTEFAPADEAVTEGIAAELNLGTFDGPDLDGVSADGLEWQVDVRWWNADEPEPYAFTAANSTSFTSPRGPITRSLTFADDGFYEIAVTVTDNDGQTAVERTWIDVFQGSPAASIAGLPAVAEGAAHPTVTEGTAVALTGQTSKLGLPDAVFGSFLWNVWQDAGEAPVFTANTRDFSFTPATAGEYRVTFSAEDENGTRTPDAEATIVVTQAAPTATIQFGAAAATGGFSGLSVPTIAEGSFALFSAAVGLGGPLDTIASTNGYAWNVTRDGQLYALPDEVRTNLPTLGFAPPDQGDYLFSLVVTDSDGVESAPARFSLIVENAAPILAGSALEGLPLTAVPEGTPVTLAVTASDAAGDTIAYAWSITQDGQPFPLPQDTATTASSFTFTPTDNGVYVVSVLVSDEDGGSVSRSGTLQVNNAAPTAELTLSPAAAGSVGYLQGDQITFTLANPTDAGAADRGSLRYWFGLGPDGTWDVENAAANTFMPSAFTAAGTYTVRAKVADKDGSETTYRRSFTIGNRAPTIDSFAAGQPAIVRTGDALRLTGSFSDSGTGETYRGTATIVSPSGSSATLPLVLTGSSFQVSYTFADEGEYTVTATVRDSLGAASDPASFVLLSTTAPIPESPTVTGIYVKGSRWNANYLALSPFTTIGEVNLGWQLPDGPAQLADSSTVSWNNINTISVQFSLPVSQPAADALQLIMGTATGNRTIVPTAAPLLVADGTVATWTLPTEFPALRQGQYMISLAAAAITGADGLSRLDGEWTTGSSQYSTGSGDGTAGGDFEFVFNALVGDVNTDGRANPNDIRAVRGEISNSLGIATPAALFRLDIDGSGRINGADINDVRGNLPNSLGVGSTGLPPVVRQPTLQAFSELGARGATSSRTFDSRLLLAFAEIAGDLQLTAGTDSEPHASRKRSASNAPRSIPFDQ